MNYAPLPPTTEVLATNDAGAGAVYLAWQWRIVQARKAVRTLLDTETIDSYAMGVDYYVLPSSDESIPLIRRMMGDSPFPDGLLPSRQYDRVRNAFPEANIERTEPIMRN